MKKYQKLKKRYYKNMKINKHNKSYFDNFCIRLFISSILLLLLVIMTNNIKLNVSYYLNQNFNFTKIGYNLLSNFIDYNNEQSVSKIDVIEQYQYKNNQNIICNASYNGVNCLSEGTIIDIKKVNNKYTIKIQTIDDFLWTYKDLETIDCYLYEYINLNDQLGTSAIQNNAFTYLISIYKNNKYYSLEEV